MKRLFLSLYFLCLASPAWCTDYYVSQSTGDNGNPGTYASPFKTAEALSGVAAPGDNIYFKRGDTWTGAEADIDVNATGSASAWLTFDAYGAGTNPTFEGCPVTAKSWTNLSGAIYYVTGITGTPVFMVAADGVGLVNNGVSAATLLAGQFYFDDAANRVYVRLADGSNPSGHSMRVGEYLTTWGGILGCRKETKNAPYVRYKNLIVRYANITAFEITSPHTEFYNCVVECNGHEGFLFSQDTVASGITAAYSAAYNCTARYCNTGGDGHGQAFTTYAPYVVWQDCLGEKNHMESFNFLDYSTTQSDVHDCFAIRCTAIGPALAVGSWSPGFQIDGAHNITLYGCVSRGFGTGVQTNPTSGFIVENEHPALKTVSSIYLINCLSYGNYSSAFACTNFGTSTADDIRLINCTFWGGSAEGSWDVLFISHLLKAGSMTIYNCILGQPVSSTVCAVSTATSGYIVADYNQYYTSSASLAWTVNNVDKSLAQWQAVNGQDAHSAFGDPKLLNTTTATFNPLLDPASPALNAGLASLWTGAPGVTGTTLASKKMDSTAKNLGYHTAGMRRLISGTSRVARKLSFMRFKVRS